MRAYRIQNDSLGNSYFEVGTLPEYFSIASERFVIETKIQEYQKYQHPAPHFQYVVTLKGKLRFTVSNSESFIIEPGIILVAKDTEGEGHSWEILDGDQWHRVYVVPHANAEDHFIRD